MRKLALLLIAASLEVSAWADPKLSLHAVTAWQQGQPTGPQTFELFDDLVAYWSFDYVDGTTVFDSKGTNDVEMINGPTIIEGKSGFGNCVDVNGSNHYLAGGNISLGDGLTDSACSFGGWYNLDDVGRGSLVGNYGGSDRQWMLYIDNSGHLNVFIYDESLGDYIGRKYATSLSPFIGVWKHYFGTYNGGGTAADIKVYIDGVQVDDTDVVAGSYVAMDASTHPVWIGRYGSSNYAHFQGDEIGVWTRELSSAEVLELFTNEELYRDIWDNVVAAYSLNGTNRNEFTQVGGAWPAEVTETNDVPFAAAGTAAYFDGTDDSWIICADSQNITHEATNLTMAVWVKPLEFDQDQEGIFFQYRSSSHKNGLETWTTNQMRFDGSGSGRFAYPFFATNEWQHMAMVCEVGQPIRAFINGVVMTGNTSDRGDDQDTSSYWFGRNGGTGRRWKGYADEGTIWLRVLSDAEVIRLYNEQLLYTK